MVGGVFGAAGLGLAAIPAYKFTATVLGSSKTTSYSLYNLMFGCDATATADNDKVLSIGLLIALILAVVGIIAAVACLVVANGKGKKKGGVAICGLVGFLTLAAAGVLFFCTKNMTGVETGTVDIYFASGKGEMGPAPVLSGICCCLGGLFCLPSACACILK